jgi:poly(A) polymerase
MHSGSGVDGYKKLRELDLLKYLFPFTNKILLNNEIYNDFIIAAIKNTDSRINDGLHVNPSFIYAVFLWPYFQELEENFSNSKTMDELFKKVIHDQSKFIAIPDFFQSTIFSIWSLQSSFLNLSKRNVSYLTGFSKFRAAYDFFYIRSLINDDLKRFADHWYEIQKNVVNKKRDKGRNFNDRRNKRKY